MKNTGDIVTYFSIDGVYVSILLDTKSGYL